MTVKEAIQLLLDQPWNAQVVLSVEAGDGARFVYAEEVSPVGWYTPVTNRSGLFRSGGEPEPGDVRAVGIRLAGVEGE